MFTICLLLLLPLAIGLGCVVSLVHNQILGPVVLLSAKVTLQNGLGTGSVPLLGIERRTGHVSDHGVSAAEGVLGVAEGVVLRRWLREPDVATVSAEVTGLESLGDVLLDDDGATRGVDKPRACLNQRCLAPYLKALHTLLHLGNQILVEQAAGLLVQRAVDGDNVALAEHLLEAIDSPGADFLLDLGLERLVIEVEELLALERLQSPQDTLADSANSNRTHDLVFQVVFVLGDLRNVPVPALDLLVGRDEVADKGEDGHDDMLGNGNDVGPSDFGNGNAAIGLVRGIEVDVVGPNAGSNGNLELLGLGQTLGGEVCGVEASSDQI